MIHSCEPACCDVGGLMIGPPGTTKAAVYVCGSLLAREWSTWHGSFHGRSTVLTFDFSLFSQRHPIIW